MLKFEAREMKELDRRAQEEYGIPSLILMENAGIRASETAVKLLERRESKSVVIFCGPGNNAGDGFVTARHLINNDIKVKLFLLTKGTDFKGDALTNYLILKKMHAQIIELSSLDYLMNASTALAKEGLIIDAIFGIGLNKDIEGFIAEVIQEINKTGVPVLALDVPSGLCATTGRIFKNCLKAHTTIAFGAAKSGFFKLHGQEMTGELIVADISLPKELLNRRSVE